MESVVFFGDWVRRRRKALDLTQQVLANRVGCSLATLQKIERDERRPSRQLAERLAEFLELPPDLRAAFVKVARGERLADTLASLPQPVVPPPAAPAHSAPARPALPVSPTPLVGRQAELSEVTRLLGEPACRLLTLTGPGGIGKTRLALAGAHQMRASSPGGVYFIPLAGVSSPEFILPAIADALGFVTSGPADPKAQLLNYLRANPMLLVLDSLEHLLKGIALLGEILQYAPSAKVLATSREPLRLQAEWTLEVQGLPVPLSAQAGEMEASSAVALFLQRARQARVGFTLAAEDRPAVVKICQLVGGLPLGIELAAAWVRTLACPEIAREIESGLDFLATAARDVPERHLSMTAVFDHSWKLLEPDEQRVLERLSRFRGGFMRDAAQAVAGARLPLLSALVDKSLVRHSALRAGRYEMHGLIRQYAAARLAVDQAEEQAALERHSDYYLTLLQAQDTALRSGRQKAALQELAADIDNLRAAWDAAVASAAVGQLHRAAFPLWYFYNLRDGLQEGEAAFARAAERVRGLLAQLEPGQDGPARSRLEGALGELLSHQAQFTFRQGRNAEAAELYQASLALLRPLDEPYALVQALTYCGVVCWIVGEFDQARHYLDEGLALAEALADQWAQAQCRAFVGMVAHAQGHYDEAYRCLSDSLASSRELGDTRFIAFIGGHLARTAQALNRLSEVQDLLGEGLRLATETGDRLGIGLVLEQLAVLQQAGGDAAEARRLIEESIEQFRAVGDTWFLSHALYLAGQFALAAGDDARAQSSFRQAGEVALAAEAPPNLLDALAGLAQLCAHAGQTEPALELALFILNESSSMQDTKARASQLRAELESAFSPEHLAAIQARAQAKTLKTIAREFLAIAA